MSSSGDGTIVEMEIPRTKVGTLIGPNGTTIMELQNRFNVKMAVQQESTGPTVGRRVLRLYGPEENVEKAKQAVLELIDSIGDEEMEIPRTKVGELIGPRGETILQLQNRFDVKMVVRQESTSPTVGRKVLQIRGPTDNVEKAKQAVIELIDSIAGEEMDIPNGKVGALIGPHGETIVQLQNRFNVKMVVQQESRDSWNGRKVLLIRGDHANVEMARQAVLEILSSISNWMAPRAIYQGVESTVTPFGMQGPAPQQQIHQTTNSAAVDQHPDQSHYSVKASKSSREVITIEDDSPPRKEEPDKIVNFKEGNYDDDFPPL